MSHENARKVLAQELSRLQNSLQVVQGQISEADKRAANARAQHAILESEIMETASALKSIGGPVPDWTEDKDLIAFWDQIKDA